MNKWWVRRVAAAAVIPAPLMVTTFIGSKVIKRLIERFLSKFNKQICMSLKEAWTKLIAYILTDGSINFEGDNGIYLTLISKDINLLIDFQNTLKEFGLSSKITKHGTNFKVRKGCKKLANELIELCRIPVVDKKIIKKEAQIPDFILADENLISLFLKIVASTEGYVKLTKNRNGGYARRITLGSINNNYKRIYSEMLNSLGINSKIAKNEVKIYGFNNFIKFKNKIGFVNCCKVVREPRKGVSKEELLNEMISTYSF